MYSELELYAAKRNTQYSIDANQASQYSMNANQASQYSMSANNALSLTDRYLNIDRYVGADFIVESIQPYNNRIENNEHSIANNSIREIDEIQRNFQLQMKIIFNRHFPKKGELYSQKLNLVLNRVSSIRIGCNLSLNEYIIIDQAIEEILTALPNKEYISNYLQQIERFLESAAEKNSSENIHKLTLQYSCLRAFTTNLDRFWKAYINNFNPYARLNPSEFRDFCSNCIICTVFYTHFVDYYRATVEFVGYSKEYKITNYQLYRLIESRMLNKIIRHYIPLELEMAKIFDIFNLFIDTMIDLSFKEQNSIKSRFSTNTVVFKVSQPFLSVPNIKNQISSKNINYEKANVVNIRKRRPKFSFRKNKTEKQPIKGLYARRQEDKNREQDSISSNQEMRSSNIPTLNTAGIIQTNNLDENFAQLRQILVSSNSTVTFSNHLINILDFLVKLIHDLSGSSLGIDHYREIDDMIEMLIPAMSSFEIYKFFIENIHLLIKQSIDNKERNNLIVTKLLTKYETASRLLDSIKRLYDTINKAPSYLISEYISNSHPFSATTSTALQNFMNNLIESMSMINNEWTPKNLIYDMYSHAVESMLFNSRVKRTLESTEHQGLNQVIDTVIVKHGIELLNNNKIDTLLDSFKKTDISFNTAFLTTISLIQEKIKLT